MKKAQRKALVIGISDYTNLQKLDFCKNDGKEIYEVLGSLGYEISDKFRLVGEAKGEKVRDAIYDFFDNINNNLDDTLLLYYSGHGVPDVDGDMYLASSDTDPDKPYRRGFSFEELTKMIQKSISTSVVVILDCCYSGSAKISKGHEEDAAKIGRIAIDEKSRKLPLGQGKYILSASQAAQEAYALTTGEHSIFTYYLLQGLRGETESVDSEGNVTPQSLARYVYRAIMSLPADKRPRQTPITRAEESGDVILASHPELGRKVVEAAPPTTLNTKGVQQPNKYQLFGRDKYRLIIPIIAAAIVVGSIIILLPGSILRPATHGNNVNDTSYNAGTYSAISDMGNGIFNPACDPGGYLATGAQHAIEYCKGWTSGYISEWNAEHPGWTSGYISEWIPRHVPVNGTAVNGTVMSCQNCSSGLKPIVRYINGSNDGGQAALSDTLNRSSFNPACDPTGSHASDALHTVTYCNGWTNGYISTWNTKHTSSTNTKPLFQSLTCTKNANNNSLICRYLNGASSRTK